EAILIAQHLIIFMNQIDQALALTETKLVPSRSAQSLKHSEPLVLVGAEQVEHMLVLQVLESRTLCLFSSFVKIYGQSVTGGAKFMRPVWLEPLIEQVVPCIVMHRPSFLTPKYDGKFGEPGDTFSCLIQTQCWDENLQYINVELMGNGTKSKMPCH